ncbi:MAG: hydrolase phosphatase [Pirellulaceae bacterium]|nr:MAG: hydrolase phosphatase [Pirellulaceae bacterium]
MIRFIYFDLGNVLLFFDPDLACRRMAEVAGVTPQEVKRAIYDSRLMEVYELGRISSDEWYWIFCHRTRSQPDYEKLLYAAGDMFTPNEAVWDLAKHLRRSGYRLGILSNTCDAHWRYCRRHYADGLRLFEVAALSFELGVMKPSEEIFHKAADLAGVPPAEIFFVDDRPEHVAGARQVGFDAVRYEAADQLAEELRRRKLLGPTGE